MIKVHFPLPKVALSTPRTGWLDEPGGESLDLSLLRPELSLRVWVRVREPVVPRAQVVPGGSRFVVPRVLVRCPLHVLERGPAVHVREHRARHDKEEHREMPPDTAVSEAGSSWTRSLQPV
eukprot:CAMPEP_0180359468 /NCGR_PEP_ID=MMETSP0989-20121125/11277_1 /TAXON_ID=697907 /ORGANISM="non described non described, Strain CCMP2293" /LENGTH=120 /DNA_ID=CAMNT_0022350377 /DNA_START=272 /DNA_END=635 /DNA_ORIENTATION=-